MCNDFKQHTTLIQFAYLISKIMFADMFTKYKVKLSTLLVELIFYLNIM